MLGINAVLRQNRSIPQVDRNVRIVRHLPLFDGTLWRRPGSADPVGLFGPELLKRLLGRKDVSSLAVTSRTTWRLEIAKPRPVSSAAILS